MPTALLSVYDKKGLVELAQGLVDLGWDLLASGGTAALLCEHQLAAREVADYTRSPELLGGRVKTLHPAIHAGLLARDSAEDFAQLAEKGWQPIDLAVVNLYPFEKTIAVEGVSPADAIEQIDIGGVALIRAAAKNFSRVTLVSDPHDYEAVLSALKANDLSEALRHKLAVKGFRLTARYDQVISDYLAGESAETLTLYPQQKLRYGENPHQAAEILGFTPDSKPLGGTILQGKELSYNNLLDLDAAWRAVVSFPKSSVVIVKHLSPCGIASDEDQEAAYRAALASDPVSAFGGVIALNREVQGAAAAAISELFVECVIAPTFHSQAMEIFAKKKNLRLVAMPNLEIEADTEYRSVVRGMLRQSVDKGDPDGSEWQVVSKRQPTAQEMEALKFAWAACRHVKSNAIVFAQGEATVGIGGGQPNRVDCVAIAAQRAGEKANGAVMASDAFFPFPDSVEAAARAGIRAIIQPGGSLRDKDPSKPPTITASPWLLPACAISATKENRNK